MRKKIMPFPGCKVYSDGSHFIAIPHTTRAKRKAKSFENISGGNTENVEEKSVCNEQPQSPKTLFEEAYKESAKLPKKQRKKFIQNQIEPYFENPQSAQDFVDVNIERKRTNFIARKVRLMRKVNLQDWNYFCIVTYYYTVYDTIVKSLNLTENMRIALECRQNGLCYPEIGRVLSRAQAVYEYFIKMRQRYTAIYG